MSVNWSAILTSDATPVYTPGTSNFGWSGSIYNGQHVAVNNSSADVSSSNLQRSTPTRTHHSNYNGPDITLAIFRLRVYYLAKTNDHQHVHLEGLSDGLAQRRKDTDFPPSG
jgi:hypothetical protein